MDLSETGLSLLDLTSEEYEFHEEEFCHVLPEAVRPRGLSQYCDQRLTENCEEVADSPFAEALNKTFQLEGLPKAIMTIIKHKTGDDQLCQEFKPALVAFVRNVAVHTIDKLETEIVLREQGRTVGKAKVDFHFQQDGMYFHFYVSSRLTRLTAAKAVESPSVHHPYRRLHPGPSSSGEGSSRHYSGPDQECSELI